MIDRCIIRAKSGTSTFDESTGKHTVTPDAVIYPEAGREFGICKRQSPPGVRAEMEANAGDHDSTLSRIQVQLPALAPPIPAGAVGEMLECPLDPGAVGRTFRVDGPAGKTFATAQRLNVTEVVG